MSTVDPGTSARIAAAVTATGAAFLEAPVSGSKGPAIDGQLIILAAGDAELYAAALPAFEAMGKKSFLLGEGRWACAYLFGGHEGKGSHMLLLLASFQCTNAWHGLPHPAMHCGHTVRRWWPCPGLPYGPARPPAHHLPTCCTAACCLAVPPSRLPDAPLLAHMPALRASLLLQWALVRA